MTAVNLFESRAATLEAEEQLVIDAAIWRGLRNAILPSLAMWALIVAGVKLGVWMLP